MKVLIILAALSCNFAYAKTQMSDEELSGVSARGLDETIYQILHSDKDQDGLNTLSAMIKLVNPALFFLNADVTMTDVIYDTDNAVTIINSDGSFNLRLPSTIGLIDFQNIRVGSGPSFGSIQIRDIDLRGTTISIKFH